MTAHPSSRTFLLSFTTTFLFCIILLLGLSACTGKEYSSPLQSEAMALADAGKNDAAIAAFRAAINRAAVPGRDPHEPAHLKSLLGHTLARAGQIEAGLVELREAVRLARAAGSDPALFLARLSLLAARAGRVEEGIAAADQALALLARSWETRAASKNAAAVIDYAIANHGLPPDVDMIRTVTMAETARTVLLLLKEDAPAAILAGDRALGHYEALASLMGMAAAAESRQFHEGMGICAAALAEAYRRDGQNAQATGFKEKSFAALAAAGMERKKNETSPFELLRTAGVLMPPAPPAGAAAPVTASVTASPLERAQVLVAAGRLAEAETLLRKEEERARKNGDRLALARVTGKLGWLLGERGRFGEATRLLKKTVDELPYHEETPALAARLAVVFSLAGHFEQGGIYADKALDVVLAQRKIAPAADKRQAFIEAFLADPGFPPDSMLLKAITAAASAGVTVRYMQGDMDDTIRRAEKALSYYDRLQGILHFAGDREQKDFAEGRGFTALMLGDALLHKEQAASGKKYLEQALAAFVFSGNVYGAVISRGLLGYAAVLLDDGENGGRLFLDARREAKERGFYDSEWRMQSRYAAILINRAKELDKAPGDWQGQGFDRQRREARALQARNDALTRLLLVVAGEEKKAQLLRLARDAEEAQDAATLRAALGNIATFLRQEAREALGQAVAGMEALRLGLETDSSKRLFLGNKDPVLRDFVTLNADLAGAAAGFEALERIRAQGLRDLLATRDIAFASPLYPAWQEGLRQEDAGQEKRRTQKPTPSDAPAAGATAAGERLRSIAVRLRHQEPELASLQMAVPLELEGFQRLLPDDTVALEYFVSEEHCYIWAIDRGHIRMTRSDHGREVISRMVRDFRRAIVARDDDATRSQGAALYDILIRPATAWTKGRRLVLIPYDSLHYLPFQALWNGKAFLVEEQALSYAPSADVLRYTLQKTKTRASTLVAFGNPDLDRPELDLPAAEQEAARLGRHFPGAQIFLRREATESRARKEMPTAGLIHIASHAEFSNDDPLYSGIRLRADADNDGRLEAAEIFSLILAPELVVLSACQTGMGAISSGDELLGLVRAFLYAGAPAVVASLWNVNDLSTGILMEDFYRQLRQMPKDAALRRAQLFLLASPEYRQPFHWAAFTLAGDWRQ